MYTKTELKKIAQEQKYVYVVLNDDIEIVKYPAALIDFNYSGSKALFDLNSYIGEITVYKNLEDSYDCLKADINFKLEESTEEYIYEQNELREKLVAVKKLDKKFINPYPVEKVVYVRILHSHGVIERIMKKLGLAQEDIYTMNNRGGYFITYSGIKYILGTIKTGLRIDEEIWEKDLDK